MTKWHTLLYKFYKAKSPTMVIGSSYFTTREDETFYVEYRYMKSPHAFHFVITVADYTAGFELMVKFTQNPLSDDTYIIYDERYMVAEHQLFSLKTPRQPVPSDEQIEEILIKELLSL